MDSTDLAFAGIARQAELIRDGEVSPRELVDLYLERIERLDPQLNSFRVVFAERARAEAQQAEARRGAGGERPLLGVPIAVKDNVGVAGEVSAFGSAAHGGPVESDCEIARRLRAAGAILIGKTHMSELAIFPWTETETFGPTRNPWDRSRTAGGSSGGSGAAVAAGLVGSASGSDGGGSIRIPAAVNGLFGLKPQRGRVSFAPDPQHWYGLSAAGALTRTVLDAALYLDAVSGPVAGDAHTPPPPERSFAEAARTPPGRLRVAVSLAPEARARVDDRVRRAVEEVAQLLRSLGHEVSAADPDYGRLDPVFTPRWLRGIHDDAERLPHRERLERRSRLLARGGRLVGRRGAERAVRAERAAAERINRIFDHHDVLLTPTLPEPPHAIGRWGGRSLLKALRGAGPIVAFTRAWNVTGQPAASFPTPATDGGVPLAAQLVARPNDELTILSLAAQLEAEIGWPQRRPPGFA